MVFQPPVGPGFEEMHRDVASGQVYCSTVDRRLGSLPVAARVGDAIAVFQGGEIPLVLRRRDEKSYVLVGEFYIHRIMFGESMQDTESDCSMIALA